MHTEKVGVSRSPKRMTDSAKKAQKKAAKEAGKGFKDSFKDTVRSVKSAGKTLVNATGINGKQKKEQAVDKIYGITRGIGTTIAHPIRSVKEIASAIRKKAKEKGESYVGGYILGEVTQTAAAAGVAAAAGKGLKGAKAAKKNQTLNSVRREYYLSKANQAFIDEQIAANKTILLSDNPHGGYYFSDGSKRFYQRELDYLRNKGYTFEVTDDGLWKAVRK